ncbi:hypothetical protein CPB83DRAFT_794420 [Crepidotus variabilis]|uniref:F-box domain-containing protein n=1 Tax=Crepidotus variabilis TaxID=179855 RepID=A0A9P6JNG6_9AGAR|nr:hypothetical protein CPB83DRAFT_794420 [Crepidotus variabilis]
MSKRSHSPGFLPPAKRFHALEPLLTQHGAHLSFDRLLYDELILVIFSYFSWGELCSTQSVSKNWARLAGDNEIWRRLYLKEFGRTRLRGSKGFFVRKDGREVKPLPGRARNDLYKDWKWMFRISSNWRRGRCLVEDTGDSFSGFDSSVETNYPVHVGDGATHVVLAGPLTITASSQPSDRPAISIFDRHNQRNNLVYEPQEARLRRITALALDQSPPDSGQLSLGCFLSTNEFSLFAFNAAEPSLFTRTLTYRPPRRRSSDSFVTQAAYYHPLVVTLSNTFVLSIYDLASDVIRLTQTLSAITCYPPTSLVLSSPSTTQFKLVVGYATPVYPRHWSVGSTELMITKLGGSSTSISTQLGLSPSLAFQEEFRHSLGPTMMVTSSRTIRAFDTPNVWLDTSAMQAMREQWGRKLLTVAATQTDGKWVVLAPGNNLNDAHDQPSGLTPSSSTLSSFQSPTGLQLYRLVLPTISNSVSAPLPKLNFVRTLHGQSSAASALALADGRCVSLGENGSIWVWDLEAGSGAEVASGDESLTGPGPQRGTVTFDERRIVSASAGKVVVRRFDI